MNQRFTLDRKSFEQFIAAVSIFQSLQHAANRQNSETAPLLEYLIETLRAIDSRTLSLPAALERVAGLALHIAGGDRAVVWLFTKNNLICRAAAGSELDDAHIHTPLRSKLQSAGAFEENPPARLDLTRTLETASKSLGSPLAIALLPGRRIAGALAVFADPSRTFTERNYANLRLLAGLAQYILTKWLAERDQPEEALPTQLSIESLFPARAYSPIACSPPFISREPEPARYEPIPDFYVPGLSTRAALGSALVNDATQIAPDQQSPSLSAAPVDENANILSHNPPEPADQEASLGLTLNRSPALQRLQDSQAIASAAECERQEPSPQGATQPSPALQRWVKRNDDSTPRGTARILAQRWENWKTQFKRRKQNLTRMLNTSRPIGVLTNATWDAAENISRHLRNFRRNRFVLKCAAPAILAIMFYFVGRIASDRHRLAIGSLNPVAEAATQPAPNHNSTLDANQKTQIVVPAKSAATPAATSHLQVTDPETAATIANLSQHEVQNLRRAADYGDDEAALELGMLYELGRGFPQSCRQAATWITRAAQQGNAAAQYNLGLRYRDGDGVAHDLQQAENWFRRAAAHKNLRAVRALSELPSQATETSVSQITKPSQPTTASP